MHHSSTDPQPIPTVRPTPVEQHCSQSDDLHSPSGVRQTSVEVRQKQAEGLQTSTNVEQTGDYHEDDMRHSKERSIEIFEGQFFLRGLSTVLLHLKI